MPAHTPVHTPSAEANPPPPVNGSAFFGSAFVKKPDPLKLAWGATHKSRNTGRETRSRPPLVKRDTLEKELARELDTAILGASASRHNKGPARLLHGLHAPPGISSSTSSSPSPPSSPLHSTPASVFVHAAGREGNEALHTQQNWAGSADADSPHTHTHTDADSPPSHAPSHANNQDTSHANNQDTSHANNQDTSHANNQDTSHAGVFALESRYVAGGSSILSKFSCPGESTGGQDERTVGRRGGGDAVASDGGASSVASGSSTGASAKKRLPKFDPSRFDDDICELFSSLRRR